MNDRWTNPPADFQFVLFERINPAKNENRFYYLIWQRDLLGEWAVVRIYGRRDGQQQIRVTPFLSLAEAWPTIRAYIRTRLRHGYRMVHTEEKSETIRPGSL